MNKENENQTQKKSQTYWRHVKCRIDEVCKTLGLAEYKQAPDCSEGSLFADALQQLLNRPLSKDDLGCLADKVITNWATIQSTISQDRERNKKKKEHEVEILSDGPDSMDEDLKELIRLNTPKRKENRRKREEEVVELLDSSDDEIITIQESQEVKNEDVIEIPDSQECLSKTEKKEFGVCPLCAKEFEFLDLQVHAAECNGAAENENPHSSKKTASWEQEYWQSSPLKKRRMKSPPKAGLINQNQLSQSVDSNATCPLCSKVFYRNYIEEHTADCLDLQNNLLSPSQKKYRRAEDLRNRWFRNRTAIDPRTGAGTLVNDRFTSNGAFRHDEADIEKCRLERFQHEINKSPQPIRRGYPCFDKPTEPTEKCFLCSFEFLKSDFEEHATRCAERHCN